LYQIPKSRSSGAPAKVRVSDAAIEAALELLCERFPRAFVRFEGRRRPLKLGIRDDVRAALNGAITDVELHRALRIYCTNAVYRSRLVTGATRVDLNGEAAGVVAPEHALASMPKPKAAGAAKPQPKSESKPKPKSKPGPEPKPEPKSKPIRPPPSMAAVKRMSLADLREAAQRRKASERQSESKGA